MRFIKLGALLSLVLFLGACASAPIVVQDNLSPEELVQRAQEASERGKYDQAIQYYDAVLTRFPGDLSMVCAAEYEIAFIQYKQKRYEPSKAGFRSLLERYSSTDAELLPPQYRILAEKVLSKMELEGK
jgi:outer membrane protein assembly factor BamD (BamD/ComL family)